MTDKERSEGFVLILTLEPCLSLLLLPFNYREDGEINGSLLYPPAMPLNWLNGSMARREGEI